MPCIWQTSMTDDPGATLCAKIRSFSSTLQRRRRFGPARTSPWTSRALIRVLRRSSLSISVPSPITPPPKTKAAESRSPCRRQKRPSADAYLDHAGQTVDLLDGSAGEIRPAQIFVAVTDASNYAYAEATPTQGLPDRVGAHVPALAFVGGVPLQPVLTTRRSGSIAPTGTSPASTDPGRQDAPDHGAQRAARAAAQSAHQPGRHAARPGPLAGPLRVEASRPIRKSGLI